MPVEWWRWKMVKETGWTLAEVDALTIADWHEYMQIMDAEYKATKAKPR